ncbi:uncharacterized protein LOC18052878 [Citrus clementina]|uniref:uncharacterized protein LOC18052878 n=1 Tax=Citrus clementina TaxID=85681 RepID=UPI000CED0276|nr:uncharacterized protein LOC18052878 [Citrus x clementina]
MQSFSEEATIFWNQWEIRILVLLSLAFQTILTIFGSRRKFTEKFWIQFLVWSSYLSADWVAIAALSKLARSDNACEDKSPKSNGELQLHAFWAPFLLIHLGGPDTITAFSLEDNELWLRHFLSLVVQFGVAIYVYLRFWSTDVLTYIATPILIVGAFKYGERVFVLYSSSKERLTKFSLPDFTDDVRDLLWQCELLFTSQFLDCGEVEWFRSRILEKISEKDIFKITAFELGFMYDFLYTKAKMIYSGLGIAARCFSLLSSVTALVLFPIFIDIPAHPLADIIISCLLLIGTIFTDLYGFILHVFSYWTKFYLSKYSNRSHPDRSTYDATFFSHPLLGNHKRWCRSMGQLNLLSYCIKGEKTKPSVVVSKLLAINKTLRNQWYVTWADVSDDLENLIFRELKEKVDKVDKNPEEPFYSTAEGRRIMSSGRGDYVLEERYNALSWLLECTALKPYGYNLLAWHIATELCYREDLDKHCHGNPDTLRRSCKISKCLSDYMFYLLVVCPSLMPEETDLLETIYKHTCCDIIPHDYNQHSSGSEASPPLQMTAEEWQDQEYFPSAARPGRWLGQQLQCLASEEGWTYDKKWKMISEVWVEIWAYAASQSTWNEHGQHLSKGGELLTHVRLLMAHLGLSSQYLLDPILRRRRTLKKIRAHARDIRERAPRILILNRRSPEIVLVKVNTDGLSTGLLCIYAEILAAVLAIELALSRGWNYLRPECNSKLLFYIVSIPHWKLRNRCILKLHYNEANSVADGLALKWAADLRFHPWQSGLPKEKMEDKEQCPIKVDPHFSATLAPFLSPETAESPQQLSDDALLDTDDTTNATKHLKTQQSSLNVHLAMVSGFW